MTTTTSTNTRSTHHGLVGNALQLLGVGLGPYIASQLKQAAGRGLYVPDDVDTFGDVEGDVAVMLKVMATGWNEVFRDHLTPTERSLVSEIRETRNRWAHMEPFDDDDLDRALDSIGRLLTGVGAHPEGERVHKAKHRLRRRRYGSESTGASNTGESRQRERPTRESSQPAAGYTAHEPATSPEPNQTPAGYTSQQPAPTPEPHQPRSGYTTQQPAPEPVEIPYMPGVDNGDQIESLIQQGVASRQQGEFHTAITSFGKAISINREHADAWYHRALTWGHMGEFERAINDFNRVISLDHGFADAYNGRGYALFCLGDDPRAIADFEQAMQIDPDDELTKTNLEKAQQRWADRGGR